MMNALLGALGLLLAAPSCSGLAGGAAPLVRRVAVSSSRVAMATAQVPAYSTDGAALGEVPVTLRTSAKPMYVVHRKVVNELANRRQGTVSVKTRSEVSGGGRKPYKQKGTGRARRGSSRSPLLVGGGKCFGPKPKDWSMKMNKKERRIATASAIMGVLPRAIVVDDLEPAFASTAKTSAMMALLKKLPLGMELPKKPKVVIIAKEAVRAGSNGLRHSASAARRGERRAGGWVWLLCLRAAFRGQVCLPTSFPVASCAHLSCRLMNPAALWRAERERRAVLAQH